MILLELSEQAQTLLWIGGAGLLLVTCFWVVYTHDLTNLKLDIAQLRKEMNEGLKEIREWIMSRGGRKL